MYLGCFQKKQARRNHVVGCGDSLMDEGISTSLTVDVVAVSSVIFPDPLNGCEVDSVSIKVSWVKFLLEYSG